MGSINFARTLRGTYKLILEIWLTKSSKEVDLLWFSLQWYLQSRYSIPFKLCLDSSQMDNCINARLVSVENS